MPTPCVYLLISHIGHLYTVANDIIIASLLSTQKAGVRIRGAKKEKRSRAKVIEDGMIFLDPSPSALLPFSFLLPPITIRSETYLRMQNTNNV